MGRGKFFTILTTIVGFNTWTMMTMDLDFIKKYTPLNDDED